MKAQALTQVGFTLTFPPHTLYSLPVHSVGTQGRWVPLGDILAIIKQHKPSFPGPFIIPATHIFPITFPSPIFTNYLKSRIAKLLVK